MSVQKIDYEDKIGLQNDPNVPDKNKVLDEDMNEIKSVVNNNADELTTAQQNIEDLQSGQGTASTDITNLKNRVTTLETDNTTNKQDISNLKSRTTTLETDNETNKTNISTLQEDVEEIESNITEIQQEQTAQNKKIEELDDNQIHITTEKSSNINVQDCSNLPAKVNVFGNSIQNGEPSPDNKVDIENVGDNINLLNNTWKKCVSDMGYPIELSDSDDTVNITSSDTKELVFSSSSAYRGIVSDFVPVKKGEYFTISLSGSKNINRMFVEQYDKDKTRIAHLNKYTNYIISETIVATEDGYITVGFTNTTIQNDMKVEQVKLEKGAKKTSYSPYNCGNVDVTVYNKNLWNDEDWELRDVIDGKNVLKFNGYYSTGTGVKVGTPLTFTNKFKKGTTYIVSGKFKKTTYDNQLCVMYTDFSIQYGGKFADNFEKSSVSITTSSEKEVLYFAIFSGSSSSNSYVEEGSLQLEENSVETDYIENEQQTITFPLAEGQKLYEGDYLADDGIHHVRKQIKLDRSEGWQKSANYNRYIFRIDTNSKDITYEGVEVLCNYYKKTTNATQEGIILNSTQINTNVKFLGIIDNSKTTLEAFTSYLAQQKEEGTPVIIEFVLKEEEIEPYTEEQQEAYNKLQNVLAYKLVTNIFTDKALLEFKYVADTETWVINEIKPLKEQISTINQLLSTTNTSALLLNNMQTDLESEVV